MRRVKEGTSVVLLQSGLNESWWADTLECYTHLRNVTDLLSVGKTSYERRFGQPFKGPIISFGFLVDYHHPITSKGLSSPYDFEGSVKNPSIWKESFTWIVSRIRSLRGGNLEGWRNDRRHWGVGDDGRIGNLPKKVLIRKRWYFPKKKDNLFSNRRWTNQNVWRNFIFRHHDEPRVKLLLAEKRIIPYSTEIHWRNQNYSYEFGCRAWATHRWPLQYQWVKRFVWSLDRFHTIYSTRRKTSKRIYVVRGEIDEETAYIQARLSMARALEINGKAREAEGLAKVWGKDTPWKSRKLRGICFIDPEDTEFKETIKNARKKLETPVAPAILCKTSNTCKHGETRGKTNETK